MRFIILAALFACAHMGEGKLFLPRLPLSVLLRGNIPFLDSDKIVGGSVVAPNSLPFQISLQRCGALSCSQSCGGSVLDANVILNAAHCVRNAVVSNFRVVAGEHSLSQVSGDEQNRGVTRYTMHENYNANTFTNDIALIFLDAPLTLSSVVAPVNLPPAGFDPPAGTVTTVSGWGTTSSGGSISDLLRSVDVPIVDDATCDQNYGVGSIDYPSMICAGLPQGGVDSCQGDSGGPLFTGTGADAVQHGIVSWGYGCAVAGYPGVYTQVSTFIDWIATNRV